MRFGQDPAKIQQWGARLNWGTQLVQLIVGKQHFMLAELQGYLGVTMLSPHLS